MPILKEIGKLNLRLPMQEWYNSTNKNQKILMWSISTGLILVYGTGLAPLAVLTYLQFGSSK